MRPLPNHPHSSIIYQLHSRLYNFFKNKSHGKAIFFYETWRDSSQIWSINKLHVGRNSWVAKQCVYNVRRRVCEIWPFKNIFYSFLKPSICPVSRYVEEKRDRFWGWIFERKWPAPMVFFDFRFFVKFIQRDGFHLHKRMGDDFWEQSRFSFLLSK